MIRPKEYGFKTKHTGNRKHKASTPKMREMAEYYGRAHGYTGRLGGWIYDSNGQHIAHGWGQFWHAIRGTTIRAWAVEQKIMTEEEGW